MRSEREFSAGASGVTGLGQIEYRLARESTIREFHKGRLSRLDICDAQPELLRVARNLGTKTEVVCPICEEQNLVHVSFAFAPGLPSSGRALSSTKELATVARTYEAAFYIVEVCTGCSWNHLVRMFNSSRARRRRAL